MDAWVRLPTSGQARPARARLAPRYGAPLNSPTSSRVHMHPRSSSDLREANARPRHVDIMNTATTSPSVPRNRIRRRRSAVLKHAQVLEFQSTLIGPPKTRPTRRGFMDSIKLPANGRPRPGSMLANFAAQPREDDGLVYVSVEGHEHRRAVVGAQMFRRLTARDPDGPWLTRTRWWLDDEGHMRAYSRHDAQPFSHGVLVAAAILGAVEGEAIEVPADPFDLRLASLRRLD